MRPHDPISCGFQVVPSSRKVQLACKSRETCSLSGGNYRRAFAQGGRIISANDCLILHILQMDDGATREEVAMNLMNHQQAEREAQRVQANREELVERIARAIREDGPAQPLQGLHLYRSSLPLEPVHSVVEPSFCVIAQGSKEVLLGDSRYRYDHS